ncbi:MAG: tRNA (adenosine(37)-N6)-dimethylallyltransferase MiaA [Rhodospirillaceae bacterium]
MFNAVIVAGPTAGGKSALGLALAREFGGVIINADSQQRYRDLPTLTAQPSAADKARLPHKLFADLGPDDSGSAADWSARAAAEIRGSGDKLPIIVGGTGLYLRALTEGLSEIPPVPADIRNSARALMTEIGADAFHARLVARDPLAAKLAPGDSQRNLRAFEVIEATGVSLWTWQERTTSPPLPLRTHVILLMPPRDELRAACDARFDAMIAAGAVEEVRALRDTGVSPDAPVMKILGAREIAGHLDGQHTLKEAADLAKAATRQYAKRQSTWFRNQVRADLSLEAKFSPRILPGVVAGLSKFVAGAAGACG